jgi:cytochrome c oxidase subunit 1
MWPLIRAFFGAVFGYLIGAALVLLIQQDGINSQLAILIGYVGGLIGWLVGIGLGNTWIRQLVGLEAKPDRVDGWRRYFTFNTDHKVIGIQYGVMFIAVLGLGGISAMLMRIELMSPGKTIMDGERYNQVMSMHGILMVAVAVAATLGSLGNYLVPIMIGADDMAFPRLNALSFWLIPPVAFGLLLAPAIGSFDAGWTAYPPFSVVNNNGQVLFCAAVIVFGLASIFGGLNIIVTVITMRAKGMTYGRLPIFVWGAVAASILSLLLTQFFAAALVLILMDRIAGTTFFNGSTGGDPLLYQHLFWFYSHPAVYVMVLPGFGAALEVITHMSRKPLFAYKWAVGALMGIVALSTVVWAHHMFTSGMANYFHAPFMFLTETISVPTGIIFLSALGTLWRGKMRLEAPLLLGLIWVFQFLMGGITGIFLADVATDVNLQDTYFVVAHFHYTIMGGVVFAFLAAVHFWFPKITGRMYNKKVATVFAIWIGVAFQTTFIPMFWAGTNGMNRRIADYASNLSGVNMWTSISAFVLGAGFLLFFGNLIYSAVKGPKVNSNPWNATTLEWQVSSPPPHHNFPSVPEVTGETYPYGTGSLVNAVIAGGD